MAKNKIYISLFLGLTILIGIALLYMRHLAPSFVRGTNTFQHPYIEFAGALMLGGLLWTGLIALIPRLLNSPHKKKLLWGSIGFGLICRLGFLGTVPIYEDDWNRYLWDGAVITKSINPYKYSPCEINGIQAMTEAQLERFYRACDDADRGGATDELKTLLFFSNDHDQHIQKINFPELRTIYPPVAQAVFTVAAFMEPISLTPLRLVYALLFIVSIVLMIVALRHYGRDPLWAALYALNPLLIYSGFNVVHMDVILVPFMLGAMILVKTRPFWAGALLAGAGAVKLWPLVLAPIVFRGWRSQVKTYILIACVTAVTFILLTAPLFLSLGENSGLSAYAGEWERSSFIFPRISYLIGGVITAPGQILRILIALFITALSLYYGFFKSPDHNKLPLALMVVTLTFYLISPTGYPWYMIWFLYLIPFVPSYGVGVLTALVSLYYVRYALGEQNRYHVYEDILVPLQFGIPIIIMVAEVYFHKLKRKV